jgi:uncharacterized protein (DUF488 family)
MRLYTIGHSTRELHDFVRRLRAHGITRLVDVRTIPRSRRHPQFDRETLPAPLAEAGIVYAHMGGLGGRRTPRPDSTNTAWRNAGFRGYADYMQTSEFRTSLEALIEQARRDRVAIMCAEAVPWRCHRSLVADALVARQVDVHHITTADRADPHALTAFARVDGDRVSYPATNQTELPLR